MQISLNNLSLYSELALSKVKIVGRSTSYMVDRTGFPFPICKCKICGAWEMQRNKGIQTAEEESHRKPA